MEKLHTDFKHCPYCGDEMRIRFDRLDKRYLPSNCDHDRVRAYYECWTCESRSPSIDIYPKMINEEMFTEAMAANLREFSEEEKEAEKDD